MEQYQYEGKTAEQALREKLKSYLSNLAASMCSDLVKASFAEVFKDAVEIILASPKNAAILDSLSEYDHYDLFFQYWSLIDNLAYERHILKYDGFRNEHPSAVFA